ncbi:MAG: hypothetical protein JWQ83_811 [Lacunisphaera sp.]|nr:hypothetical protein [Lacunisphaera sp.]MDB6165671.1 hypothetical protein [Lacunisphaera sp.]
MKTPLLFLTLTAAVMAQHNDRDHDRDHDRHSPPLEPRVILYADANFRGSSVVLGPGDLLENLSSRQFPGGGRLNDSISSIRLEGPVELYAYADAGFTGPAVRVTDDLRDLTTRRLSDNPRANWNDRISSLRVREVSRRGEREPEPAELIQRAFHDLLARDPNPQDLRYFRTLIQEQNWNDRLVREQVMQWDEYRREGVNRIIRRVYREVLRREPESRELDFCRRNFLEKNWTEADLREDLHRTGESRSRPGERH